MTAPEHSAAGPRWLMGWGAGASWALGYPLMALVFALARRLQRG